MTGDLENNVMLFSGMKRQHIAVERTLHAERLAKKIRKEFPDHADRAFEIMEAFLNDVNQDWYDEFLGKNEKVNQSEPSFRQEILHAITGTIAESLKKDTLKGDLWKWLYEDVREQMLEHDKVRRKMDDIPPEHIPDGDEPYKIKTSMNSSKPLFKGMEAIKEKD